MKNGFSIVRTIISVVFNLFSFYAGSHWTVFDIRNSLFVLFLFHSDGIPLISDNGKRISDQLGDGKMGSAMK
jgi:hypothetical protein